MDQSCFGNSHEEAWLVLFFHKNSMYWRSSNAFETLNLVTNQVNWALILERVISVVFKFIDKNQVTEFGEKEVEEKYELLFLLGMSKMYERQKRTSKKLYNIDVEKVSRKKEKEEDEEMLKIKEEISKNTGITKTEVLKFVLFIFRSFVFYLAKSYAGQTVYHFSVASMGTETLLRTLPLAESFAHSMAMLPLVSALVGPLALFSFISFSLKGLNLLFGSTEGRLFSPILLLLNQKLLLAARGVNLKLYEEHHRTLSSKRIKERKI